MGKLRGSSNGVRDGILSWWKWIDCALVSELNIRREGCAVFYIQSCYEDICLNTAI